MVREKNSIIFVLTKFKPHSIKVWGFLFTFVSNSYNMWRVKQFLIGIHNLVYWFPVIWNDRNWDGEYTLKILQRKIKSVRKYTEKRKFYVGWENEVKWMKICECLLELYFNAWDKEPGDIKISLNGADENRNYYSRVLGLEFKCDLLEYKSERLFWKILSWKNKYWWD